MANDDTHTVSYEQLPLRELMSRLAERDDLVEALRKHEVDAVVGDKSIAVVRLLEVERELQARTVELQNQNEELRKTRETLERQAGELERVNTELEAFTYSISHDLRNPLNHILLFVELLKSKSLPKLDEREQQYVGHLDTASKRLQQLLASTLKLFRISKASVGDSRVDLSELARRISEEMTAADPQRARRFEIAPGLAARGDEYLLQQLLQNLLANADKYSADSSPAIIEVGAEEPRDGYRVFYVRDNGIGFDPQKAEELFVPFVRLNQKKNADGTGIGLSVVQRIVHRHHGEVWAEGRPEEGATFYFRLPVPSDD